MKTDVKRVRIRSGSQIVGQFDVKDQSTVSMTASLIEELQKSGKEVEASLHERFLVSRDAGRLDSSFTLGKFNVWEFEKEIENREEAARALRVKEEEFIPLADIIKRKDNGKGKKYKFINIVQYKKKEREKERGNKFMLEASQLKQDINLEDFLGSHYNIVFRNHMALCPFHEDENASLSVKFLSDKWQFRCFGCGTKGSIIDFVMEMERVDFKEALELIARRTAHYVPKARPKPKTNEVDVKSIFQKSLAESKKASEYLIQRSVPKKVCRYCETHQLYGYSIYDRDNRPAVVFPITDPNTLELIGVEKRYTDGNDYEKKSKALGHKSGGLFLDPGSIKKAKFVFFTEGPISAISLFTLRDRNPNMTAAATMGALNIGFETKFLKGKKVYILFDNDDQGREGEKELLEQIGKATVLHVGEEGQDPNDILQKQGVNGLYENVKNAINTQRRKE